jgi:hypothetical protein
MEGIMTMWKRWIQGGVLCGLLLGGVVGCSMVPSPPVGQIAQNDHAALAAWYDKEAAQLQQKAKNMEEMKVAYRNNPGYDHSAMGGSHKQGIERHCDTLAALYLQGAGEADALAREHRSMMK